jgi:periplasmic protein TonB
MSSQVARHPAGAAFRLFLVAALHAGFGVLVVAGLALDAVLKPPPPPIEVRPIDEPRPKLKIPLQPLNPSVDRFTVVPPPDVPPLVDDPAPNNANAVAITTVPPVDAGGGSAVPEPNPVITAVRADPRYPLTQPAYPPASRRFDEQGVVIVGVYVLPNGQVGDARIERGSGFERLDAAALSHSRRWRLVAASRDNVPYAAWYSVRVVFRIEDQ